MSFEKRSHPAPELAAEVVGALNERDALKRELEKARADCRLYECRLDRIEADIADAITKAVAEERERLLTSLMQAFGPDWLPEWLREWIVSERSSAPETVPPIGTPGRYRALQKDPDFQALVREKEREIEPRPVEPAKLGFSKEELAQWALCYHDIRQVDCRVCVTRNPMEPAKEVRSDTFTAVTPSGSVFQPPEPRPNEADPRKVCVTCGATWTQIEKDGGWAHVHNKRDRAEIDDLRSRLAQVEAERDKLREALAEIRTTCEDKQFRPGYLSAADKAEAEIKTRDYIWKTAGAALASSGKPGGET